VEFPITKKQTSNKIQKINQQKPRFEISNLVIEICLEIVSCILVITTLFHFLMLRVLAATVTKFAQFQFFFDLLLVARGVVIDFLAHAAAQFHHVFFRLCRHTISNNKLLIILSRCAESPCQPTWRPVE